MPVCPECDGTGEGGSCGWCGGSGQVYDMEEQEYVECPRCDGSGENPDRCAWCSGSGEVEEDYS